MANYDYDYFVIGAGSGGVRSSRIAAGHGAKVGIAESTALGGTCVNIGCVPKKLFAYASDFGPSFDDAKGYGWSMDNVSFDWNTLIENKNKEISRLNGIYEGILERAGVELIRGYARFIDDHTLDIDGKTVTAEKILIATGGKPRRPNYEGAEHAIVSDDAFYLKELPKHVVIEGAGYIAVEFAHIFHGMGAKVTVIYRGDSILRGFDAQISDFLANEMKKQGINIELGTNIIKITDKNDKKYVKTDKNNNIECDLVLSAIGRVPYTQDLRLENANIAYKDNGQIIVNEDYQTNVPNIYAAGDVTDRVNLTPVALAEGHVLADRLFNNQPDRAVSYDNIPTAVFSNPQIGTVGLSEEDARNKYSNIKCFTSDFKPMVHTLSGRDERTFMKVIVDQDTDIVVGVHICGRDAAEMTQALGIAVNCGATKADFDRTIGIHPTSAEEFVTMR
ncbi:MAG: glutathione-disulfide reductase [Micavibrio sp.]|nr:glutathione-disulfide reductase [Micavibrio sp.]